VLAIVACVDAFGAPITSEFTASCHRERAVISALPPKYFGYLASLIGGQATTTTWSARSA
jgi:hypothetical protein